MKPQLNIDRLCGKLEQQVQFGLCAAQAVLLEKKPLCLKAWLDACERHPVYDTLQNPDLLSLWKYLIGTPELTRVYKQALERIRAGREVVLSTSERLRMVFKSERAAKQPTVVLLEPLVMVRGREGLLRCGRVKSTLSYCHPDAKNLAEEALALGANPRTLTVNEGTDSVEVNSINQAYTLASRRLEPERMCHTGRIYDDVYWVAGGERMVSLGAIRESVEEGSWTEARARILEECRVLEECRAKIDQSGHGRPDTGSALLDK